MLWLGARASLPAKACASTLPTLLFISTLRERVSTSSRFALKAGRDARAPSKQSRISAGRRSSAAPLSPRAAASPVGAATRAVVPDAGPPVEGLPDAAAPDAAAALLCAARARV